MDSKKATDEQLIAAYSETKSFRAVARQFGMNKKTVQTRLSRISSKISSVATKASSRERLYEGKKKVHVITSAQNATAVNKHFLAALELYCKHNDAKLHVMKVPYKNPSSGLEAKIMETDDWYSPEVIPYLLEDNLRLSTNLIVMGGVKIAATASNPLTSTQMLAKGDSAIFASTQLRMQSFPRLHDEHPILVYSSGAITVSNMSDSKQGFFADFNHQHSAIIAELEEDGTFHLRDVCWDGSGFFDFDRYYPGSGEVEVVNDAAFAVQPGDVHAKFMDETVFKALFGRNDALCRVVNPDKLYLHDLLDCYSVSHHHDKSPFTKFAKFHSGDDSIEDELDLTTGVVKKMLDCCGIDTEAVIVDSNHCRHFKQWLERCNPNNDPKNAEIYHQLMYLMLKQTKMTRSGTSSPDPFKLYCDFNKVFEGKNVRFIYGDESERFFNIEMSIHGDIGAGGSRGSPMQMSRLPVKANAGHTHCDAIQLGYRAAGTMSYYRLEYNAGPSSWTHGVVITYRNGERQNVRVINGKYRLSK